MWGSVSVGRFELAYRAVYDLPAQSQPACDPLTEFLVERYIAWTCCNGIARRFDVAHEPWQITRALIELVETSLLDRFAPWLGDKSVASAHISPGAYDVLISAPHSRTQVRDALNRAGPACR